MHSPNFNNGVEERAVLLIKDVCDVTDTTVHFKYQLTNVRATWYSISEDRVDVSILLVSGMDDRSVIKLRTALRQWCRIERVGLDLITVNNYMLVSSGRIVSLYIVYLFLKDLKLWKQNLLKVKSKLRIYADVRSELLHYIRVRITQTFS